jgi:hypothetical protein
MDEIRTERFAAPLYLPLPLPLPLPLLPPLPSPPTLLVVSSDLHESGRHFGAALRTKPRCGQSSAEAGLGCTQCNESFQSDRQKSQKSKKIDRKLSGTRLKIVTKEVSGSAIRSSVAVRCSATWPSRGSSAGQRIRKRGGAKKAEAPPPSLNPSPPAPSSPSESTARESGVGVRLSAPTMRTSNFRSIEINQMEGAISSPSIPQ